MNDKAFWRQLQREDRAAIETLVGEYGARLTYFALSFVKDISAAEDIVQDAVVKLIVSPPRLTKSGALKTYLFQTVKHGAIDFLRKRKRTNGQMKTLTAESERMQLEELLFQTERQKAVQNALCLLPKQYQEVLYLRYFEDLPVQDVAKVMKKSKKQVYNLLARAKDAAKPLLKEEVFLNEDD